MALFVSAKKHLAQVKNYIPGKPLEELERELGIKNAVKMASNENALGPSPKALKAAQEKLALIHRYPDGGCFYLRNKLSKILGVSSDSLVFGNGSDEILILAVRAFVNPGDEVVIAEPTFLIYEIATQVEAGKVVKVPMKNFRYDLEAMREKVTSQTKLVFIANPDNPVGTYVTDKELSKFLASVPREVVVVVDEAYFEFAMKKKDYPNAFAFLKKHDNLLVTRTFSKAYGLSGLRIGYGAGNPDIIAALNKVREPFNVNLIAQAAALAALDDKAHLKKTLAMVDSGRRYLEAELKKLGVETVDTATNFILCNLKRDAESIYQKSLKRGVIVRAMGAWGMKNFIRVTIGKPADNKRFIETMKSVLTNGEN
jgi:histidinol-phosphate aminotransferase